MSDRVRSEGELIATYLAPLSRGAAGAFSLSDDCALIAPDPAEELVVTMDAIAAGVHFFGDDTPEDIAWKALAVNVSDLAAKAARPVSYVMSLSFPEAPLHAWMRRFSSGLAEAQAAFGIQLIGGDTDKRPGPLAITITAIGSVPKGGMIERGTARPGDVIFVSGCLGDAALGLLLRTEPDLARLWALSESDVGHLVGRYLRPLPCLALREALTAHASAAMDLSDGLAKDLGRMCAASGTGAEVDVETVPRSNAAGRVLQFDPSLIESVLAGGDDFEILAAVPPGQAAGFAELAQRSGIEVRQIGRMLEGEGVSLRDQHGRPVSLSRPGWDHF